MRDRSTYSVRRSTFGVGRLAPICCALIFALAGAGCDRARGQATRDAARCEDLRTTGAAGAVEACRTEVENGCAAFGAEDPFCGMAHIHLALALGGDTDPDWTAISGELESGERILCAAGGRWGGECAQATSLRQRFSSSGKAS